MSDQRFDLSYEGLILPGADPEETRRKLAALFKLSEQGAERLFSGKPVSVKRGVDSETVELYEKVFSNAGAVLTVIPLGGADPEGWTADDREGAADAADAAPVDRLGAIDTSGLSLSPLGFSPLEPPVALPATATMPDIRYLSLVPGDDWTFEDCAPLPTPVPIPDLSYLSLVPLAIDDDSETPTKP